MSTDTLLAPSRNGNHHTSDEAEPSSTELLAIEPIRRLRQQALKQAVQTAGRTIYSLGKAAHPDDKDAQRNFIGRFTAYTAGNSTMPDHACDQMAGLLSIPPEQLRVREMNEKEKAASLRGQRVGRAGAIASSARKGQPKPRSVRKGSRQVSSGPQGGAQGGNQKGQRVTLKFNVEKALKLFRKRTTTPTVTVEQTDDGLMLVAHLKISGDILVSLL